MLTHHEAQLKAPTPKFYYEALVRNGNYLPKLKEPIMTMKFMKGIKSEKYWVPNTNRGHGVYVKLCADPPSRKLLAKILQKTMMTCPDVPEDIHSSFRRTAKLIKKNPPNVDWMVTVLGNLKSDHFIFAKDYVAPKTQRKNAVEPYMVDNQDDFFSGLPDHPGVLRKRKRPLNYIDPAQKKQRQVNTVNRRMEMLREEMNKL